MSRLQRFVRTVVSSYALMFLSMLYQLGSIPLALRFLSKEQFGLWVLMTQIAGYLLMVDFGITYAIARLLITPAVVSSACTRGMPPRSTVASVRVICASRY